MYIISIMEVKKYTNLVISNRKCLKINVKCLKDTLDNY